MNSRKLIEGLGPFKGGRHRPISSYDKSWADDEARRPRKPITPEEERQRRAGIVSPAIRNATKIGEIEGGKYRSMKESSPRQYVEVTFEDVDPDGSGMKDTIYTSINGTEKEVRNYYAIGKQFNLGGAAGDHMARVVKVEFPDGIVEDYQIGDKLDQNEFARSNDTGERRKFPTDKPLPLGWHWEKDGGKLESQTDQTDDYGAPVGPMGMRRFPTSMPGQGGGDPPGTANPQSTSGILLGMVGYSRWKKDMEERGETVPSWREGTSYKSESKTPQSVVDELIEDSANIEESVVVAKLIEDEAPLECYTMTDQPATCPRCGRRITLWLEGEEGPSQVVRCEPCDFTYRLEEDEDALIENDDDDRFINNADGTYGPNQTMFPPSKAILNIEKRMKQRNKVIDGFSKVFNREANRSRNPVVIPGTMGSRPGKPGDGPGGRPGARRQAESIVATAVDRILEEGPTTVRDQLAGLPKHVTSHFREIADEEGVDTNEYRSNEETVSLPNGKQCEIWYDENASSGMSAWKGFVMGIGTRSGSSKEEVIKAFS